MKCGMELHDALSQITEIRSQMARAETFRGYRSATIGISGLFALGGAAAQAVWVPRPSEQIGVYLGLWIALALLSVVVCGAEMAYRAYRATSPLTRQITLLAVEQFLPCVVAGALVTFAVARFAPASVWMLPGLWAIVFSLGVFASCRLLPRQTFWVAVWYLIAGVAALALARNEAAFSPWAMVGTFGAGQFMAAAILYFTLERNHE